LKVALPLNNALKSLRLGSKHQDSIGPYVRYGLALVSVKSDESAAFKAARVRKQVLLGAAEGDDEGWDDGCVEGKSDGLKEGMADGIALGLALGLWLGEMEGPDEGKKLG